MKYDIRDTAAAKSVSAWVILKRGKEVATVRAHYGNGGSVTVNVWQRSDAAERSAKATERYGHPLEATDKYNSPGSYQADRAGGYGYDKFTAALGGMWIDGHRMSDHSSRDGAPKPPKGLTYFPADYKCPKGYSLANYGEYDEQGKRRDSYSWSEAATAELGEGAAFADVQRRVKQLRESANLTGGYSNCYKADGLKFLQAIGYTVIQAL